MRRLNSQRIIHVLTVVALLLPGTVAAAQPSSARQAPLNFEARMAYQRAIEEVFWRHRIWPKENPGPKPPLDAVLSPAQLQAKVEDALRLSNALEKVWNRPITGEQLQAEIERMAQNSKQPEVLRELWQALGNDPYVIAEMLARPILAERLARHWYAQDERFQTQSQPFDNWWQTAKDSLETAINEPAYAYTLPQITASAPTAESWTPTHALPEANLLITAVWTGSEMIIWGGTETGAGKFNSGSRYNPATDTWRTTAAVGAPMGRKRHTAVWTGTEMIVWGGCGQLDEHNCQINTGGRYNPATETWTPTSTINTPGSRMDHTAVWTGSEMIVWGGCSFVNNVCRASQVGSIGGRYNPATDTWQATSVVNAPGGRTRHTAVWTNSEMIVWGGTDDSSSLSTGGRYNPVTDTWQPTASISSGFARYDHTAIWSGRDMIVWGGTNGINTFNNGARYNPATNRWRLISNINAPSARSAHTAVWTGTEMIIWGGWIGTTLLNTGGRYNPRTNTWTPTSTVNAPPGRAGFVSVWTGTEMIIWGGDRWQGGRYAPASDTWILTNANEATSAREWHTATWTGVEMVVWGGDDRFSGTVNTGGRYTLATDSWQPTPTTGAPGPRSLHTAIWTGTEVIVWGGGYGSTAYKTGGRYNPTTNTWTATGTVGAPEARASHSAVWTGTEMIVWGGNGLSSPWINTGGRYNPATDTWTATSTTGAPSPRYLHAAVWTGTEMIVWGGATATYDTNTGGRYNPVTNTWTATSTVNAPSARDITAAVWTGSAMLIWGGQSYIGGIFGYHNTGGLYDPATNSWTATSTVNAPSPRAFFGYVWTNVELIVWGGCTQNVGGACQNDVYTGGRFDPATNTWVAATTTVGAPSARNNHTAVWTGSQMIVWGGFDEGNYTYTSTGGIYVPGTP